MAETSVDTVFVKVADLDRAVAWYRDVLGVSAGARFGDWQTMDVGGETTFALHEFADVPNGCSAVIALRVVDLDAAIDLAVARGVKPIDPDVTDTGNKRFATFEDPDGNHIQLIQPN